MLGRIDDLEALDLYSGRKMAVGDNVLDAGQPCQVVLKHGVLDEGTLALGHVEQPLLGKDGYGLADGDKAYPKALCQL